MEVVANAIASLEETVSSGLAQVLWQQEQTSELLTQVLKRLSSPRTTEAEELRERGNEFFRNGLDAKRMEDRERWMNLALEAYLEAVSKNPADFSVFHSLGVIQFFEKGNSEMALKCFREAAVLAEPYSPRHAAMAWLFGGYVHRNRNEWEEAYQATEEAVKLQPDWAEAHYQHAVHCALTGRMEEMRERLIKAIEMDADYFAKAAGDPDLLPFHEVAEVLQAEVGRLQREAEEAQEILVRAVRVFSRPLLALPPEERRPLQAALDTLREATGYVALRQALHQYRQDALPLIQQKALPSALKKFQSRWAVARTLRVHRGAVDSLAFSTVRVWDRGFSMALSGEIRHDLEMLEYWCGWMEEWEKRRRQEEQRRQRWREAGLCEECGNRLSFWSRWLLGHTKCRQCR
jgi:tetratricopeptide (TPR) repeat protein